MKSSSSKDYLLLKFGSETILIHKSVVLITDSAMCLRVRKLFIVKISGTLAGKLKFKLVLQVEASSTLDMYVLTILTVFISHYIRYPNKLYSNGKVRKDNDGVKYDNIL